MPRDTSASLPVDNIAQHCTEVRYQYLGSSNERCSIRLPRRYWITIQCRLVYSIVIVRKVCVDICIVVSIANVQHFAIMNVDLMQVIAAGGLEETLYAQSRVCHQVSLGLWLACGVVVHANIIRRYNQVNRHNEAAVRQLDLRTKGPSMTCLTAVHKRVDKLRLHELSTCKGCSRSG